MKRAVKNPFTSTALMLQGGGALGAYQAGVYQALFEADIEPTWVAGISIGAINAAIIAGNAPKDRLSKLREFWEGATQDNFKFYPPALKSLLTSNTFEHQLLNLMSSLRSILVGIPGFFVPRLLMPWLQPQGTVEAISFCDTSPLKSTLERLVDFERLNKGGMRFTVGATEITSGDFTTFDNDSLAITAEHVMASGALPPGLPPVKIDGVYYWDGGVVSNTPLQWLLDSTIFEDTLVFQVDLWSADGDFPRNMVEAMTREKDMRYSSRTRTDTSRFKEQHELRHAIAGLLDELPENLKKSSHVQFLKNHAGNSLYNIVHLIYHNKDYEGYSKDTEFSRLNMEAHWASGYGDTLNTLKHPEVLQLPKNADGIGIFDFSRQNAVAMKRKFKSAA